MKYFKRGKQKEVNNIKVKLFQDGWCKAKKKKDSDKKLYTPTSATIK